jgi:hypothetical protein
MDDKFNPANVSFFDKLSCFYDKNIGEFFDFFAFEYKFSLVLIFLTISQCFGITKLEIFKKKKTPIPVGDNVESCLFENWSCMDWCFSSFPEIHKVIAQ